MMAKLHHINSLQCAILVCSDRAFTGVRPDETIPILKDRIEKLLFEVESTAVVPDNRDKIRSTLKWWIAEEIPLILTSGGTGLAPSDITPETTLELINRRVPGMEEAMRASSLKITPHAMLSRGVVGIANHSLIINLPGNPKGAAENLEAVEPMLDHAVRLIAGEKVDK
jgi:molybdenum cofactor synthesis domain-containing protein